MMVELNQLYSSVVVQELFKGITDIMTQFYDHSCHFNMTLYGTYRGNLLSFVMAFIFLSIYELNYS